MKRPLLVWVCFLAGTVAVLASLAWLSRQAMELERRATTEERARTALWRLDLKAGEMLLEMDQSIPVLDALVVPRSTDAETPLFADSSVTLAQLLPKLPEIPMLPVPMQEGGPPQQQQAMVNSKGDFGQRQRQVEVFNNAFIEPAGVKRPVLLNDELLLVRNASTVVEIQRVDLSALKTVLLAEVLDLFPDASILPAPETPMGPEFLMASLPLQLLPGRIESRGGPVQSALLLAVACVVAALLLVAFLLNSVLSLSERRRSFVSSVTHELRTPLTTFALYTEMLRDGMVTDEETKRSYLATLHREAERLTHLVENVLAYARLENRRALPKCVPHRVGDLLERMLPRLESHCDQSGMRIDASAALEGDLMVLADAGVLEQIIFNLVDNACKYAADGERKDIVIDCARSGSHGAIIVRDFGKGLPRRRSRLFAAFSTSSEEAAERGKPGVGLGLELSKRLAEGMNGRLKSEPLRNEPGARIVILLPIAPKTQ